MAEVLLFHHAQGLTPGVGRVRRRAAGRRPHRPHAGPVRRPHLRLDRRGHGLHRTVPGWTSSGSAASTWPTTCPTRLVYAGFSFGEMVGAAAGPDAARRPRGPALLLVHPDQRRVGVRTVARGRARPDPRHGRRPDLRRRGRHRRRPRDRRDRSRMRSCSSTPATSTTSPTARSRRTTPTRAALLTQRVLEFLDRV